MIKDRNGNVLESDAGQEKTLSFLYNNPVGKVILKLLCRRFVSNLGRLYMESPLSKGRINKLIKANNIDMSQYEQRDFSSFNDFFTRRILEGKRNIDINAESVLSPADSKLTVYDINESAVYRIKDCDYSIKELLGGDNALAQEFMGANVLFFDFLLIITIDIALRITELLRITDLSPAYFIPSIPWRLKSMMSTAKTVVS